MWQTVTIKRGAILLRSTNRGMVSITLGQNTIATAQYLEEDVWEVIYRGYSWTVDAQYIIINTA
jgi:hypothetical protein